MTAKFNLGRRHLMQALGLGSSGLFLPSRLAAQDSSGPPKRLVIFETEHGPVNANASASVSNLQWEFRPQGLSGSPDAEWEIPLASAAQSLFKTQLAPLYEQRDKLLILEGLCYASAIHATPGNNHSVNNDHRFTFGGDTSFEQYIADEVKVEGQFPYIFYGNTSGSVNSGHRKNGAEITGTRLGPTQYGFFINAFERLFGNLTTSSPEPMPEPTRAQHSLSRRNASVDFLQAQYQKMASRLSGEDRKKLEAHHDMLADLRRNDAARQMLLSCEKPTYPEKISRSGHEITEIVTRTMYPIAMACDLTRVGIYYAKQLDTDEFGGPSGADVHQDIAHAGSDGSGAMHLANYYNLHAQEFANLVRAFDSVPEGNGTMLDNSLIIWIPELANGWHRFWNVMTIMAGGLAGQFKTGRYIKYAENQPNPRGEGGGESVPLGPAYSHLYVSIMQAMGVSRNSIGLASAEAKGFGSGMIDYSGPLRRLKS